MQNQDGYDLFCLMQLQAAEHQQAQEATDKTDDVTCACAKYLDDLGYRTDMPNRHH